MEWSGFVFWSCSSCCWRLLLLLWLTVALLHTLYAAAALRWVKKAAAGWKSLSKEQQQKFAPFERSDWHTLSTPHILLGAFFLAPIRFVVLVGILIGNNLCLRVLALYFGLDGNSSSAEFDKRKVASSRVTSFFCGSFLKVFGVRRTLNYFWDGKPRKGPDAFECKNIIANHVSCMDIMYFLAQAHTAFVCKESIRRTFLISWPSRFLRCIYVDRDCEADRRKALDALVSRMKAGSEDPSFNPLVVFPEGTTTNGRCLISFKRGAFVALKPVQPCVLIYTPGCMHPAYEIIPTAYYMSLSLSAWPASELKAFWLEPMQPPPASDFPNEEKHIEAFAKQVRNAMWKVMKAHHYEGAKSEGLECPDSWDGSRRTRQECIRLLFNETPADTKKDN